MHNEWIKWDAIWGISDPFKYFIIPLSMEGWTEIRKRIERGQVVSVCKLEPPNTFIKSHVADSLEINATKVFIKLRHSLGTQRVVWSLSAIVIPCYNWKLTNPLEMNSACYSGGTISQFGNDNEVFTRPNRLPIQLACLPPPKKSFIFWPRLIGF